ncbi:filamentous hemagglutinin N-terminal domain-containing protein [Pleurocapsa sp. PCC 7319]|uniref:two-partner secretion domain-containing protein n=1 Tax=Pleurocapsa sp. PCC 7319 TaxID=118161 RepID=UPI00034AEE27|nr:filamentous hemagglutinin N-terminal domain-containing protein [Pleurocapsa sp. PCC 7319]
MKFSVISFYVLVYFLISLFVSNNKLVTAQSIQPDGTTPTQPTSCSGDCLIKGGLQHGNNLFHSFVRFNVDVKGTVLFQDPGVANILSRVTGNEISEILGTLGINGGDANLFLVNPNGIIFGVDSHLDLNGSFLATTANMIRFNEQGLLNTSPNEIPLLTINPSALLFATGNKGVIRNESIAAAGKDLSGFETFGLRVPNGKSLLLIGGDIIFDGGISNAFGGRVELGGLAEAGEIKLNFSNIDEQTLSLSFTDQFQKANVSLTNGSGVSVPSEQGGNIVINAQNLTISEASFVFTGIGSNLGTFDNQAGNITLNATEKLEIKNESIVINQTSLGAIGNGGDININTESLFVSNNSFLQTATFGIGNAGNIKINAPNGMIEIRSTSRINTNVASNGIGRSGNIKIVAQEISLKDKSIVDANTLGQGNAGNIDLFVEEDIDIASESRIFSGVNPEAVGNAGQINIEAKNISLNSGSILIANVLGSGTGGDISLNIIDTFNISGFGTDGFSSGIVTTTEAGGEGQAGNISVNTSSFKIVDGGLVSSQTFNESNGGNIFINANTFSAINGGQIVTSSDSSGNAGNIDIQVADNLLLSGNDPNFANRLAEFGDLFVGNEAPGNSGLFANVRSEASGIGGDIQVTAGHLDIQEGAEVNVSSTGTGEAGSLNIEAQNVTLDRGSLTAETRVGEQGNITLNNADTLLLRNNSQITTNAAELATGGDIFISSDGIALLDNSDITAKAVRGQGGNIQITAQSIFREPDSEITAASELGIDGTITINSPEVDPASGVVELSDVPIDAGAIFAQDLCKFQDEKIAKGSSFIITGRGGLTPTSEESLGNRDRIVNWASRDDLEVSKNGVVGIRQRTEKESINKKYPEIQQSQGLVVASDGSTWLTANAPNTAPQNSPTVHPDCRTSESKN